MILVEQVIGYRPQWYWQYFYRRFLADLWQYRFFPQHRWLIKQIRQLKPESILEAGCGFGRNLKFLLKNGISVSLTGIDISRPLLTLAQKKLDRRVKLVRANLLHLPFVANRFDLVFTHGVLMHLKPADLPRALQELVRVSKRYLILIEEIRPRPRRLNYFTWAHDYDKIIAGLPVKVLIRHNGKYLLRWYLLKKLNTATPAGLTRPS